MDTADLNRLYGIVNAHIEPAARVEHHASGSALRMSSAAQAVAEHSVRFNLDGEGEDGALPATSYIASLIADLATLAEQFEPGTGAQGVLEHAAAYLGDSDPAIQVRIG